MMKTANMPSGRITAQEYFDYCKKTRGGAGRLKLGDRRSLALMKLHIAVDQERRETAKALGEAHQKSRSEFYRLKGELQQKVDAVADPDMRAIGQRVLEEASQSVVMQATYLHRARVMHEAGLA